MRYLLENEQIQVELDSHGAEMKSLKKRSNDQEYIWCGDKKYWGRTAPVLFPIVGRVVEDHYTYNGEQYELHQHGFARDMEFSLESQSEEEIWFQLLANDITKEKYPFLFALKIGYRLDNCSVQVIWKVINQDQKEMHFSIGGHPAFYCPLKTNELQTAYKIKMDTQESKLIRTQFEDGYALHTTEVVELKERGILPITDHLFDRDALIFEQDQAHRVSLVDPEGKDYLSVAFDAPVFGIWSPAGKKAPFVCIEPWYGRCDRKDFKGSLEDREWSQTLNPGMSFEKSYTVTIY